MAGNSRRSSTKAENRLVREAVRSYAPLRYRFILAGWIALLLLSYVHSRVINGTHENFLIGLLAFSTCYYLWLLLTPFLFRLECRFPITRPFSSRNAVLFLALGIAVCYGASLGALNTLPLLERVVPYHGARAPFTLHIGLTEANLQASLFLALLGVSAWLRYLSEMRQKERKAAELALQKAELEGALRGAELETLRMRLNPHFLFNCLQNISSLASEDPKAASTMIARLGDLLRVALSDDYQAQISLHQEIALTRAYLGIEQIRFGDRLSVMFSLVPQAESVQVPSLLLQPLVENALKHGLSRRGEGLLSISSAIEAGMLLLTIRNDGAESSENNRDTSGFGVGLTATRERLKRIYGEKQNLSLRSLPEGGTEIRLSLPATPALTHQSDPARVAQTQAVQPPHVPA